MPKEIYIYFIYIKRLYTEKATIKVAFFLVGPPGFEPGTT